MRKKDQKNQGIPREDRKSPGSPGAAPLELVFWPCDANRHDSIRSRAP